MWNWNNAKEIKNPGSFESAFNANLLFIVHIFLVFPQSALTWWTRLSCQCCGSGVGSWGTCRTSSCDASANPPSSRWTPRKTNRVPALPQTTLKQSWQNSQHQNPQIRWISLNVTPCRKINVQKVRLLFL